MYIRADTQPFLIHAGPAFLPHATARYTRPETTHTHKYEPPVAIGGPTAPSCCLSAERAGVWAPLWVRGSCPARIFFDSREAHF